MQEVPASSSSAAPANRHAIKHRRATQKIDRPLPSAGEGWG
jgi:hypothetical protein